MQPGFPNIYMEQFLTEFLILKFAMKNPKESKPGSMITDRKGPSKTLAAKIHKLNLRPSAGRDNVLLSEAYRTLLRDYLALVSKNVQPAAGWRPLVREALGFLGGQADRHVSSLAEYDHALYGPYLGVSDEGGAAVAIRRATYATPKAHALKTKSAPLTLGVALDAERLGSIGEVPVGPDEYADIWTECAGRLLMTTNVGSRANLRLYNRAPVVTIPANEKQVNLEKAETDLAVAFKPFLEAPGGPRPLVVYVEFDSGSSPSKEFQQKTLRALVDYTQKSGIAAPRIHEVGLNVQIGWGQKGCDAALDAIDVASLAGIKHVSIDGIVRKDADKVVSLSGLLNYLPPELINPILQKAKTKGVQVSSVNMPDADSVAREIWTGLNAARAMGFDLGKYGLFPLSLEESDRTVKQVQQWFPRWTAAPVFYIDQGVISAERVYAGADVGKGVEVWLRVVAKHKVRVVLIDTVDKSKGWRILKSGDDPKGILTPKQIAHLNTLGQKLGIKVLWAGGITLEHAHQFGKLGVFGIYVTTSASKAAPVEGSYLDDPELASEKKPTFAGVLAVKTLLEAGFLLDRVKDISPKIHARMVSAGLDPLALSEILPEAWRLWWKHNSKSK